jgi:hypothetical protein
MSTCSIQPYINVGRLSVASYLHLKCSQFCYALKMLICLYMLQAPLLNNKDMTTCCMAPLMNNIDMTTCCMAFLINNIDMTTCCITPLNNIDMTTCCMAPLNYIDFTTCCMAPLMNVEVVRFAEGALAPPTVICFCHRPNLNKVLNVY